MCVGSWHLSSAECLHSNTTLVFLTRALDQEGKWFIEEGREGKEEEGVWYYTPQGSARVAPPPFLCSTVGTQLPHPTPCISGWVIMGLKFCHLVYESDSVTSEAARLGVVGGYHGIHEILY